VITLESVTKKFPDGTVAVHELDLEVPEGEVAVLVGPSGCGKTTTLRMINRMIEPSGGRISVDGKSIMDVEPHVLRRNIGYVIQQIGLFPHRTIADNIGTVPRLLGWEDKKTDKRTKELMELVGLPAESAQRYPHQLSGGQQQRVGVARALAVDPPIMLMDEPFGAVDPIVRERLQDEFQKLQAEVQKTIVFVTHDIDEALKMGDRIAILKEGGTLEQYATPEDILAAPASDFVADFLGGERGLKRLALIPVSDVQAEKGPVVSSDDDVTRAKEVAATADTDWVVVVDGGRLKGWVAVSDLDGAGKVSSAKPRTFSARIHARDSLRAALNALVTSRTGVAVRVSDDDHYEGILTRELVTAELLNPERQPSDS
jgi:osmoprotectant transport system ATP-binding protein